MNAESPAKAPIARPRAAELRRVRSPSAPMAMPKTPPTKEPIRLHVEIPELSWEHPVDKQVNKPKLAPVQAPTARPVAASRSPPTPDRPAQASPTAPPRTGQTVHTVH